MNRRLIAPIGVLVLVVLVVGLYPLISRTIQSQLPASLSPVTLKGYCGSEKLPFFQDAAVVKLLSNKYRLTVNCEAKGSIAQVTEPTTDDLKKGGYDFLSPSNNSAGALFEQSHKKTDFAGYQVADVFYSPMVIMAVAPAREALIKANIVTKRGEFYYIVDFGKLAQNMAEGKTWKDIDPNVQTISGLLTLGSTNPVTSNSGNLLYFLLGNTLAGNPMQPMQMSDYAKVGPLLAKIKHSQGLQQTTTENLFSRWLTVDKWRYPLVWVYESQVLENSDNLAPRIQSGEVSILYPEPDIYSTHQIIALDVNAQRLITALADPEVLALAWRHGFRSLNPSVKNDATVFAVKVPDQLTSIAGLPEPDVISRIIGCLKDDTQCQ